MTSSTRTGRSSGAAASRNAGSSRKTGSSRDRTRGESREHAQTEHRDASSGEQRGGARDATRTHEKRSPKQHDRNHRARSSAPSVGHMPRPLSFVPSTHSSAALAQLGCTPLFQSLGDTARCLLAALPDALDAVMPLSAAHRRDLPLAVHELSLLLTSERGGLSLPYWSSPRLMSAYLRYFLPWNLIRLARLLPGIGLPLPEADDLIVDFGSGPLTMAIALWMARPAWHTIPLSILAVDTSGQVLEAGRALFRHLVPDSPWRIRTLRAPLHKALREVHGRARLITTANVLNELAERGPDRRAGDEAPLGDRMIDLAMAFSRLLLPGGALCCVEPGTRLGGTLISHVRSGALEVGMNLLSPCTHAALCPLESGRSAGGWCHATLDTIDAPRWLHALAHEAGLGKSSLSLSHVAARLAVPAVQAAELVEKPAPASTSSPVAPVLLGAPVAPVAPVVHKSSAMPKDASTNTLPARVLSDSFAVPDLGLARYACTAKGLVIIPAATAVPQGALVTVRPANPPRRDAKSGAPVMVLTTDTRN